QGIAPFHDDAAPQQALTGSLPIHELLKRNEIEQKAESGQGGENQYRSGDIGVGGNAHGGFHGGQDSKHDKEQKERHDIAKQQNQAVNNEGKIPRTRAGQRVRNDNILGC